jgi:DNA-binding NtrC family response regulator
MNPLMKVVVIDDDPSILVLMRQVLQRKGHTVQTYANPLECPLYQAKSCPCTAASPCPDAVITDYNMPGVNGLEFLDDLHTRGCQCFHRAIITGKGLSETDRERMVERNIPLFFKPLEMHLLYNWLDWVEQKTRWNRHIQTLPTSPQVITPPAPRPLIGICGDRGNN